jgi:hypothetical protein
VADVSVKTALYRHFDAAGALLYVGISNDALRRLCQHKDRSGWYAQIVKVDVQWMPDRSAALAAEAQAIATENPAWNVRGQPRSTPRKKTPSSPLGGRSYDAADLVMNGPYEDRPRSTLAGMFFHLYENGKIERQGRISSVDGDLVVAQMYSWLSGCENGMQAYPKAVILSDACRLYPSHSAWLDAAERAA